MARTTLTRVGKAMADAVDEQPVGAVWAAQIAEQDEPEPERDVDGWHTVTITSETSDAIAERISELQGGASPESGEDQGDVEDPPMPREADPRSAIVDILRRRLEAVLQPVDDAGVWSGVFVITRADLSAILQQPLPKASIFAAAVETSVWQPATIYVDATCPRCGIAGEATVTLRPQLLVGTETEIKVKTKTAPVPHSCGQTRLRDLAPSRPEPQDRLPLSSPVAPPGDDPDPSLAYDEDGKVVGTVVGMAETEDGRVLPVIVAAAAEAEADVRPTGEVNAELLAGEASRSIDDESDLDGLPF